MQRVFKGHTAPPPRLQLESLPFKTIQKLFLMEVFSSEKLRFFPPGKMLQYLVGEGGKDVDAVLNS